MNIFVFCKTMFSNLSVTMNDSRGRKSNLFVLLCVTSLFTIFVLLTLSTPFKKILTANETKHIHTNEHIQVAHSACEGTLYPELCVSTLKRLPGFSRRSLPEFIIFTLNKTVQDVKESMANVTAIRKKHIAKLDPVDQVALKDCVELFESTMDEIKVAVSDLTSLKKVYKHKNDITTLLSAAMTNQYTCLDGFAHSKGKIRSRIQSRLFKISRHVSNSLAILKKVPGSNKTRSRSEVFQGYGRMKHDGFPTWLSSKDRKLLQTSTNNTTVNLIVAKDGTGNFTTVSDAVVAAPNSSTTRFVIYIKAGAYFENVEVDKKKTNIMFLGDGIGETIIKASRNVVDGWTTFRSATVAVVGTGFIAKGITFENGAGPSKHQAVALRSGADLSAFYKCSFVGYQDTLYVHSLRQFYRNCDIYGTIDFIFGNAAVVIQNCSLYARKPNENQRNIYTAQGREDPNQNTGISIIGCKVAAATDLVPVKSSFQTFLGRPWKEYSRTVFIKSYMEDLINPAGWLEWNGTFALTTLYYREYMNTGPGANTSARVTWPGYNVTTNATEVSQFTVRSFILGQDWLNSSIIPFYLNLS